MDASTPAAAAQLQGGAGAPRAPPPPRSLASAAYHDGPEPLLPNEVVIGLLVLVSALFFSLIILLGYMCRKRCENSATRICALLRTAQRPPPGYMGAAAWDDSVGDTFDHTVTVRLRDECSVVSEERLVLRFTVQATALPPPRVTGSRQRPSLSGAPPAAADPGPALFAGRSVVGVHVREPTYLEPNPGPPPARAPVHAASARRGAPRGRTQQRSHSEGST